MKFFSNFTLRQQLLVAFGGAFLLFSLAVGMLLWAQNRKEKLAHLAHHVNEISLSLIKIQRAEKQFLADDASNPKYYETKISQAGRTRASELGVVNYHIDQLKKEQLLGEKELNLLKQFDRKFSYHAILFDSLKNKVTYKGFRDYGLTGDMRSYAHALERRINEKSLMSDLLMMRRHEKDYMLRGQQQYWDKFTKQYQYFKTLLQDRYEGDKETSVVGHLDEYKKYFDEWVVLDRLIGRNSNEGLMHSNQVNFKALEETASQLSASIIQKSQALGKQLAYTVTGSLVVLGLLFVVASILTAQVISKPIKRLSSSVRNLVYMNFSSEAAIPMIQSKDEIGRLSQDLVEMHRRLLSHNEEIMQQAEQIKKAHRIIALQQEKMDASNQSILAAQNIQQLILPTVEELKQLFPHAFVYFRPRDVVSGDFYWYTLRGREVLFATIDCTGHGVSGAFLSFIANEMLNDIVHNKGITQASKILDALNVSIKPYLGQVMSRDNVGMDISLCVWDERNSLLQFAGAVNPLVAFEGDEMRVIKGDRRSIGGLAEEFMEGDEAFSFTQNVIRVKKPMQLFLFSDGFKDQLGGKDGKRFKSKRLYELFGEIKDEKEEQQKRILDHTFKSWTGAHEGQFTQLDDIVILGITLDPSKQLVEKRTYQSRLSSAGLIT